MLEEDVAKYFDIIVKYKDIESINLMHDMFRKRYCDVNRLLKSKDKNNLLEELVEYKNKLEDIAGSSEDSSYISQKIINEFEIKGGVERQMNSYKVENSVTILHLSDIHMVSKYDAYSVTLEDILRKISIQIANDFEEKIDFICITGDIAYSSKKDEYENFKTIFIDKFRCLFEQDVDMFDRILLVPGNHDIFRGFIESDFHKDEWKEDNDISNMMLSSTSMVNGDTGQMWNEKILKKFTFYKNFEKDFISDKYYDECKTGFSYYKEYNVNGISIGFSGMNSAWSYGKQSIKDKEKIAIGYEQFNQINSKYKSRFNKLDANMLLIHHPCKMFEEKLNQSLVANYNYILCGHTHKSDMENNKLNGKGEIITGGSVFNKENKKYKKPLKFQIIKLNKITLSNKIVMDNSITHYIWDDEEWVRDDFSTKELRKTKGVIPSMYRLEIR